MIMYTGKSLYIYNWTDPPIDDEVISQVRDLAEGQDSNKMTDNYPIFEWASGVLITDDVSEEDKPIGEETEANNIEPQGEVNVEEAKKKRQ